MSDFRLGAVPSSSVLHLYSLRDSIWFDPPYQRQGDIWPEEKRQLLIDSILNGYDMPKLYFHEFFPAREIEGRKYKYAIVDGKQRLRSVFSFIDGAFALPDRMEYIPDPTIKPGGMTYAELAREFPSLKTKFDGCVLPIVTILTEDLELIEDMFSRLNEAVPLNAAEKRNAFGGVIPSIVREMTQHSFFACKLPFDNRRYRHFDLAVKFLYLAEKEHLVETKKQNLDEFVKSMRGEDSEEKALLLATKAVAVLDQMSAVFVDDDPLLRSVGSVVLYYFLFLEFVMKGWEEPISRQPLQEFELSRTENRSQAELDVSAADYHLLEYDRLSQSPNDAIALRYRYAVLRQYVGPVADRPELPSTD